MVIATKYEVVIVLADSFLLQKANKIGGIINKLGITSSWWNTCVIAQTLDMTHTIP
jgi:hypothetical protein